MRSRRSACPTSSSRRVGGSGFRIGPHDAREHRARIARAQSRAIVQPSSAGSVRSSRTTSASASTRSKNRSETGRGSRLAGPDPVTLASRLDARERAAASSRRAVSRSPSSRSTIVSSLRVQADPALVPHTGAAGHGCGELALGGLEQLDARQRARAERAPELELVAVDGHRRVGAGAAEPVALGARLVRERAGIDDDGAAVDPELERERVRVRVRREVGRRRRAAVEREPDAAACGERRSRSRRTRRALPPAAGRSSAGARSSAAVVEERRRAVGPGERRPRSRASARSRRRAGTSAAAATSSRSRRTTRW